MKYENKRIYVQQNETYAKFHLLTSHHIRQNRDIISNENQQGQPFILIHFSIFFKLTCSCCKTSPYKQRCIRSMQNIQLLLCKEYRRSKMDSYSQFKMILNKWIGSVGSFIGIDIFRRDFKISAHTIFVLIISLLIPTMYG